MSKVFKVGDDEIVAMLDRYFSLDTIAPMEDRYLNHKSFAQSFPGLRNESRFRADPFDDRGDFNVVTLGCSWAEGHGLPREQIFSERLKAKLRRKLGYDTRSWNLSHSGAGSDYISRAAASAVHALKPDLVVVVLSCCNRREIFGPDGRRLVCPEDALKNRETRWSYDPVHEPMWQAMELLYESDFEKVAHMLRHLRDIQWLFAATDTPWVFTSAMMPPAREPIELIRKAGLLPEEHYLGQTFDAVDRVSETNGHPGSKSHEEFSELVFKWIVENGIGPRKSRPANDDRANRQVRAGRSLLRWWRKRRVRDGEGKDEIYPLW